MSENLDSERTPQLPPQMASLHWALSPLSLSVSSLLIAPCLCLPLWGPWPAPCWMWGGPGAEGSPEPPGGARPPAQRLLDLQPRLTPAPPELYLHLEMGMIMVPTALFAGIQ